MRIGSVLCVCTGNICRSPLAERMLSAALPDARVASAGTGALRGQPMDPTAAMIAEKAGFAAGGHRARQLTRAIVREFELILVMEGAQKTWIENCYPESRGRVFMISHWQGGNDVADPFGLPVEVFETVYACLETCVAEWCPRLLP